jgi:hypothetical protein
MCGGMSVKRREGFLSVMLAVAAVLLTASSLSAQVKQEVPNNPSVGPGPDQPIHYSHKLHLALSAKLECKGCHSNPDPGKLMTFPATSTCMKCHVKTAKVKPDIKKLAGFDKSKTAIPWVRVYNLRPGYEWTHRKHLDAGVKCEACHGQVDQLEVMTEVTSVVSMYSCVNCHTMHKAKTTCVTCHLYGSAGPYG